MYLRGMGQNPGDACVADDGSAGTYDGNLFCVSNVTSTPNSAYNIGTECTAADGSDGSMDAYGNCISNATNAPYVPPTGSTYTPPATIPTAPASGTTPLSSILNSLFTGTTSVIKATTAPTPTYYPAGYVGPIAPGGIILPASTSLSTLLTGSTLPILLAVGLFMFSRKKGGA